MQYNIWFSVTSLVFMLMLFYHYMSKHQFPITSNKLFKWVLITVIANLALDIVGSCSANYYKLFPVWFTKLSNYCWYLSTLTLPAAMSLYILTVSGILGKHNLWRYFTTALPSIVSIVIFIVGQVFGLSFNVSREIGYTTGPLKSITYVCVAVSFFVLFLTYRLYHSKLTREENIGVIMVFPIIVVSAVVQFLFPSLLVTGTGIALSVMVIYFTIQDPTHMVDHISGVFNSNAFLFLLKRVLEINGNFGLLVFDVTGVDYSNSNTTKLLYQRIGEHFFRYKKCWTFRIGDHRFACISENMMEFESYIHDIKERCRSTWYVEGNKLEVSLAVAIFESTKSFKDEDQVLRAIDYSLRETEPGIVRTLNDTEIEGFERKNKIFVALRREIDDASDFELFVQKIYKPSQQRFVSAELLVRYHHPEYGIIMPDEVFAFAGRGGLTRTLDEKIVELAFKNIREGLYDRYNFDCVHINLSSSAFVSEGFADYIISLQRKYNIDPHFIVFEMTENMVISSEDIVEKHMHRLNFAGFSFAIDDFGTGYANIARVLRLPFKYVKLDKTLLNGSPDVYKGMTEIFSKLNLPVVAECVETKEQVDFVTGLGIDNIQGFYYSRPESVEDTKEEA